jgi:hypothetical protein
MTPPGSAGTASDGFRTPKPVGKHRAPPTVPTPRTVTGLAVAAAVLAAASLSALAGTAVAPDATATDVRGAAVTTTPRTTATAGPLVVPSIGAEGAWMPPEETRPAVRPVSVPKVPVRTPSEALGRLQSVQTDTRSALKPSQPVQEALTATTAPIPVPVPTPVAEPTPVEATETAAASTTETTTPTVTETPTVVDPTPTVEPTPTPEPVDVAVTAEVTP